MRFVNRTISPGVPPRANTVVTRVVFDIEVITNAVEDDIQVEDAIASPVDR